MSDPQPLDCQTSYDRVAAEYALRIFDELQAKPLDRQWLKELAARCQGQGTICDVGCGPGQVARFLAEQGAEVCGVDISQEMVNRARTLNPTIEFQQGDLRRLPAPDQAWAGIAAFYSLIHIPPDELTAAARELRRVLKPGGILLAAFHLGDSTIHLDEWWGQTVSVDFHFLKTETIRQALSAPASPSNESSSGIRIRCGV